MRSRLAALGAVLLGLITVALVPAPAAALSCAAMPNVTLVDLIRGARLDEDVDGPRRLFDSYDHAVVGQVTAIRPPAGAPRTRSHAEVSVDLDVLAVVNRTTTPATVTVTMGDHGEMTGYPFEVGRHYVVVVEADGQYGICGPTAPLTEVDPDPAQAVTMLQAAARQGGVPFAVPAGTATRAPADPAASATPQPGAAAAPARSEGARAPLAAGSAAACVIGLAGVAVVRRLRRSGKAAR